MWVLSGGWHSIVFADKRVTQQNTRKTARLWYGDRKKPSSEQVTTVTNWAPSSRDR